MHNGRLLANANEVGDFFGSQASAVRYPGHTRCSASHNGRLSDYSEANQVVHGAALYMRLQWSAVFFSARAGGREADAPRASLYLKGLTANSEGGYSLSAFLDRSIRLPSEE